MITSTDAESAGLATNNYPAEDGTYKTVCGPDVFECQAPNKPYEPFAATVERCRDGFLAFLAVGAFSRQVIHVDI